MTSEDILILAAASNYNGAIADAEEAERLAEEAQREAEEAEKKAKEAEELARSKIAEANRKLAEANAAKEEAEARAKQFSPHMSKKEDPPEEEHVAGWGDLTLEEIEKMYNPWKHGDSLFKSVREFEEKQDLEKRLVPEWGDQELTPTISTGSGIAILGVVAGIFASLRD